MIATYLKLKNKCGSNYIVFLIIIINLASGTVPYPRAAHASASPENNKLLIYGGAVMGNLFQEYFFNLKAVAWLRTLFIYLI